MKHNLDFGQESTDIHWKLLIEIYLRMVNKGIFQCVVETKSHAFLRTRLVN